LNEASANAKNSKGGKNIRDWWLDESPAERFNFLKSEVDRLASDLGLLTVEQEETADDSGNDELQADPYRALASNVTQLQHELVQLTDNTSFAALLQNQNAAAQVQLAARAAVGNRLRQQMVRMEGQDSIGVVADSSDDVVNGTDRGSNSDGMDARLELFYSPQMADIGSRARVCLLEERVAKLERVIGLSEVSASPSAPPMSGTSLVDLVAALETKVALMDEGRCAAVSRKLTSLTAEIDSLEGKHKAADHEIVNSQLDVMLEKLERCDGVVHTLPSLVQRLTSLQHLHAESSVFGGRLQRVEAAFGDVSSMVEEDQRMLQQAQVSMRENAQVMLANMQSLSDRLEAAVTTTDRPSDD
jgi:hypothetical protein